MKKVMKILVIIIAIILVIVAAIGIFIWVKLNKINYEKAINGIKRRITRKFS